MALMRVNGVWPSRDIPWRLSRALARVAANAPNAASNPRLDVLDAVKDWNLMTNVNLLEWPGQWIAAGHQVNRYPGIIVFNRVNFQAGTLPGTNTCSSVVGLRGGARAQYIRCDPLLTSAGTVNRGTLAHEIGHALGLYHEHQRFDRGQCVRIIPTALPGQAGWASFVRNYLTRHRAPYAIHSPDYDCESVMHYPPLANIAANPPDGCASIGPVMRPSGIADPANPGVQWNTWLSADDIAHVNMFY